MSYWLISFILFAGMFFSIRFNKLTVPAALTGGLIGFFIFLGAGFTGISMIAAFFILGTIATSWKLEYKKQQGFAENHSGKRNAGQVVANAGVAGILGLLVLIEPGKTGLFRLMMAAGFAAAAADTLSSELGNIYGRRFYNILGFRKDQKGLNGVVSAEGTLAGFAGSLAIALIFAAGYGFDNRIVYIVLAGTMGNIMDSLLGASLERRGILGNNGVNFLNTLSAALVIFCCSLL